MTCERHDCDAHGCFVVFEVDLLEHAFLGHGVDYAYAGCPVTLASWVAELFCRENCSVAVGNRRIFKQFVFRCWRKDVVVGFDGVEKRMFWVACETAWSVG